MKELLFSYKRGGSKSNLLFFAFIFDFNYNNKKVKLGDFN